MSSRHRRATWRRRAASFREAFESRLWPLPLTAVVAAVVLGVALPVLDRAWDASLPAATEALLFGGGSDAARAVLSAIAGSLISAASLTFSLTVVALQLASSQGSPRLLRMFASDRTVHATLAMFLGTFAYALTVLRTVDDATEDADAFVPRIAVTLASLLTFASVIMLTFFLAHLARQLRVETMMRDVHREASATLVVMRDDVADRAAQDLTGSEAARTVAAPWSGFLTSVDRARLIALAERHDIVVRECRDVGSSLVSGTPLVQWWPAPGAAPARRTGDDLEAVDADLVGAFSTAYERTPAQDVGFGLRQLADIAIKALSPGVNDPTTAVHVLGHISALLGDLADLDHRPEGYAGTDGALRLIPSGDGFAALVDVGLSQIRRYGAGDADVVTRMYGVFDDLGWRVRTEPQRAVVAAQVRRLDDAVAAASFDDTDRERFRAASDAALMRLGSSGA